MREEFVDPAARDDADVRTDGDLRPRRIGDFVGQEELKKHLAIVLGAARQRNEAADHLLLAGPPGLGKTTMAGIVANEMGAKIHVTSGPALERAATWPRFSPSSRTATCSSSTKCTVCRA